MNSLILLLTGLICISAFGVPVFHRHAEEKIEARVSTETEPSEEGQRYQLSYENCFSNNRRPDYRVLRRGFLNEGFLLSPQQEAIFLRVGAAYINYDYGYSVVIPKPLVGLRSPPPFPNHGFVINLSGQPLARITVDASYNAAEWNSLQEGLKAHLDQFNRDSSGEVKIVMQRPAVLGGLKAIHFSLRSTATESNEPMIRDVLLAFRKDGGVGIVYEIALITSKLRYQKDKRSAAQLVRSFHLRALPK